MRKLLSIVLALTLVLGMLPVFANEYAQEGLSPAENLRHYKFIQGDNGDLKLDQTLTRAELATIIARMLGKDEEAKAFEAETSYDDRAKFPKWAKGYISFATAQGLMLGYDNKFDANGTVNSKQAATVFLRLLGYNQGEDFQYKEAVQFLRDKGVEMVEADKILRGDLFNTMWTVVSTEVMKEEGKILGAEHGMLPPPAPKFVPIAIDEVKADNLKEVTVKFNQEIKKDELGTFAVAGKKVETVELLEDGMTVKVTLADKFDNQKTFKLTVDKTAAVNELAGVLAKEEKEFNVFDATLPEVTNVEFAGPRDLVLTFSEPMNDVKGNIVIKKDKTTIAVNNASIQVVGRTVLAQTFTALAEGSEYTVEIVGFEDLAGYKNKNHAGAYTFNKDTTAPTAEVVTADSSSVTVRFNKPVVGLKADMFWHSFTAWNKGKLYVDNKLFTALMANKPVKEVVVRFYETATDNALPEGNVKFGINGTNIKDLWGNKLGEFETIVSVKADNEKPEVVSAEAKDNKKIKVKFSKVVKLTNTHVTLKDSKGNIVPFRAPVNDDATVDPHQVWIIETIQDMEGKTVALDIKGVQDTTPNMNTVVAFSTNIAFGDKTAPTITKIAFKYDAGKPGELYFFYSEDVDASALVGTNYQYKKGGVYTKLSVDGEFFGNTAVVKFVVDKDTATEINNGGTQIPFLVSNVKDLANNAIVVKDSVLWTAYNTAVAPEVTKVVTVDKQTVDVTFNSEIADLKLDKVKIQATGNKAADASSVISSNVIRLHLKAVLDDIDTVVSTQLQFEAEAIENSFGAKNALAINNVPIVDRLQPAFVVDDVTYTKATRKIQMKVDKDLVDITGIEQLVAASDVRVFVNGVALNPTDMEIAKVDAKTFTIELAKTVFAPGKNTYSISVETVATPTYLKTASGVAVKALPLKTFADVEYKVLKVKSITAAAAGAVGDTFTITFEGVKLAANANNAANFTVDATDGTIPGFENGTVNVGEMKVTIDVKDQPFATGDKITINGTIIEESPADIIINDVCV